MKRGFIFLFIAVSIFFASFISADNASSSSYSIESYHLGSTGGNGTSASYSEESTTTFQQGSANISSATYSGRSIWFPIITFPEEETPQPTPAPGAAGGSGGGAVSTTIVRTLEELRVIPDSFGLPATVGINSSAKISLENLGSETLDLDITLVNLNEIVFFDETKISLFPGETKILNFKIIPPGEPGILTGKIVFNSIGLKTEVPFALDVNSEFSLFDVSIELAKKTISQGQNLEGQITLLQAGLQEEQDVTIEYVIKDFEGNIYSTVSETTSVLREKTFEYEFKTSELFQGDYIVGIEVIYSGGVATASHQFKIINKEAGFLFSSIFLIILVIAIFILIILIIIAKNYKQNRNV
ncbi:hypothetical protein HYT25_00040 [Candidatus Pacearchaeota archaeon]|nr:hypothetical protein [Candidatus Pacearchaeota archaeon]